MAGRPLKFQTAEELQTKIDAYFAEVKTALYTDSDGVPHFEPITITGLALALDTNRQTLINYAEKDEFFDTITKAKTMVENYAEKRLFGTTPTGAIFALKNYGWKDTQDINQNNTGAPQVIVTKNYLPKND